MRDSKDNKLNNMARKFIKNLNKENLLKLLTKENLRNLLQKAKANQKLILKYLQILLLLYIIFSIADLKDYVSSLEGEIDFLKSDVSGLGSEVGDAKRSCGDAENSCQRIWYR